MRKLKLVIPKGRIYENVVRLLNDSGLNLRVDERVYRPVISDPEIEIKTMRPQNIPKLIELGSHDAGFSGYDWIVETGADVVEVLDLKLDPVNLVAAIPEELKESDIQQKKIIVVSEYEKISKEFLEKEWYSYVFLRTHGATKAFPPDDADMIIDNTSTGKTLKEHKLHIVATLLESSTRFIANKAATEDSDKGEKINEMKMLFQAVLDARDRVMLEMNVPKDKFEEIVKVLPCMRSPTVSQLYGEGGYAIKVAVKKSEVTKLIPQLKKLGATDILEYNFRKVVL